jgi:hypothetical protein
MNYTFLFKLIVKLWKQYFLQNITYEFVSLLNSKLLHSSPAIVIIQLNINSLVMTH